MKSNKRISIFTYIYTSLNGFEIEQRIHYKTKVYETITYIEGFDSFNKMIEFFQSICEKNKFKFLILKFFGQNRSKIIDENNIVAKYFFINDNYESRQIKKLISAFKNFIIQNEQNTLYKMINDGSELIFKRNNYKTFYSLIQNFYLSDLETQDNNILCEYIQNKSDIELFNF